MFEWLIYIFSIGCTRDVHPDLLLAELNAYRFDYKSLKLISSFLSNKNK